MYKKYVTNIILKSTKHSKFEEFVSFLLHFVCTIKTMKHK